MDFDNELYHYGVLGMKWGVRKTPYKNTTDKRFSKAVDRYNRVGKNTEKYQMMGVAASNAGDEARANKYFNKMLRDASRSAQVVFEMENEFGGLSPEIFSEETLEKGKDLAYMLNSDARPYSNAAEQARELEKMLLFREELFKKYES